jgi:hypothetical protein
MQSIADKYAIKTDWLYKRNRMEPGTEPKPGEDVYIRGRRKKNDPIRLRKAEKQMSGYASTKVQVESSRNPAPMGPASASSKPERTITRKVNTTPAPAEREDCCVTVGQGDTLWRISSRTGVSVDEIRSLNQLADNTIHVGMRLRVR